jgi:hypothetical protein
LDGAVHAIQRRGHVDCARAEGDSGFLSRKFRVDPEAAGAIGLRSSVSLVRVAILDDYQQVALTSADFSVLAGRAEVVSFADHFGAPAAIAERMADFDVVVAK